MDKKTFLISLGGGFLGSLIMLGGVATLVFFKPEISDRFLVQHNPLVPVEEKTLDTLFATMTDVAVPDTATKATVSEKLTVTDVVKKANPAVVSIIITQEVPKYEVIANNTTDPLNFFQQFTAPILKQNGTEKKTIGGGSGFLISADGYIITNKHVMSVEKAEYTVQLSNGKKYPAQVIARDAVLDIGVLRISGSSFPYLTLGDSDTLEIGEQVVAIGNALAEFQNSVSQGIVSGLDRTLVASNGAGMLENLDKVIQTDAAINPGNSGGPLLNMHGEVIGVNVAMAQGSQSIGFALPINTVRPIVKSILKDGKIVRPYIGIRFLQITPQLQKQLHLGSDYGILVRPGQNIDDVAVTPGSPAQKAGIQENDIILSLNGKKLTSDENFAFLLRGKAVGEKVVLLVLSGGVEKQVSVLLEPAP